MRIYSIKSWLAFAVLLLLPVLALYLAAQQSKSLTIAGQSGSARVIQVDGLNYVEVEGLARLTNSSLRFNGDQIVLTPPGSTADVSRPAVPLRVFPRNLSPRA